MRKHEQNINHNQFFYRQRPSDSFTSLVTVDLGTMDYYDTNAIKNRLYEQIQNYQRLGSVPVGVEEFSFRKFEGLFIFNEIIQRFPSIYYLLVFDLTFLCFSLNIYI